MTQLLSQKQVAARFGVSLRTFQRWRHSHQPMPTERRCPCGRSYWIAAEVDAWLQKTPTCHEG